MAGLNDEKPLRKISESFKELAATVNSQTAEVEVAPFARACSHLSPLFGCLGIAFKFAEMDYVAKVNDLVEASKSIETLQALLERDVEADTVKKGGSHSRNLLRVKRGLDMVKVLFEQILVTEFMQYPKLTKFARSQIDSTYIRGDILSSTFKEQGFGQGFILPYGKFIELKFAFAGG